MSDRPRLSPGGCLVLPGLAIALVVVVYLFVAVLVLAGWQPYVAVGAAAAAGMAATRTVRRTVASLPHATAY